MTSRAVAWGAFAVAFSIVVCACGSPDRAATTDTATQAAPVQTGCDLEHGQITFDAPRADGTRAHGPCDACLQASCCAVTVACFGADGTGPCAPLDACLGACPAKTANDADPKALYLCRDACRAANAGAEDAFDGYLGCRESACKAVCGDT